MEMDYLVLLDTSYRLEILALIAVGIILIITIIVLTLIKKAKGK